MKKIAGCAVAVLLILLSASCTKESHSIRFRNNYSEAVKNVVVGPVSFGTVLNGRVSDYEPIAAGNFSISGVTLSGANMYGAASITGKGTHKWTLLLSTTGKVWLQDDETN